MGRRRRKRHNSGGVLAKPSRYFLQQSSAGFTRIAGGKLTAQFDYIELGAGGLKGLLRDRRRWYVRPGEHVVEMGDAHQEQCIA